MAFGRPTDHATKRHFISLGRPPPLPGTNKKRCERYRCRHCSKEQAAASPQRLRDHLAGCSVLKATQEQQSSSVTIPIQEQPQKKLISSGIQRISKDENDTLVYDAAAAVISDGRPFNLFESQRWHRFFARIKPGWMPPSRKTITSLLPSVGQEVRNEVLRQIRASDFFNIIFDASDNVSHHRIVNISVQLPDGPTFYWKTFDTGNERHTAENWVKLIWTEMLYLCDNNPARINSICTDTENTMRSVHDLLGKLPVLRHVSFSLCDSHGLQLLIKDILLLPYFEETFKDVSSVLTLFSRSKLQLSRLRACQRKRWNGIQRALIRRQVYKISRICLLYLSFH